MKLYATNPEAGNLIPILEDTSPEQARVHVAELVAMDDWPEGCEALLVEATGRQWFLDETGNNWRNEDE